MSQSFSSYSRLHPAFWLSTWFGCGLMPKAPGTWGSLAALGMGWGIVHVAGGLGLGLATVVVSLLGWWSADVHGRKTGTSDASEIVIDEVAGQWLVLLAAPPEPLYYAVSFALFRLLDITKPWPISWADRTIKGGLGVMLDDLIAGLGGALIISLFHLYRVLP